MCVYALRIVPTDKILRFINTLITNSPLRLTQDSWSVAKIESSCYHGRVSGAEQEDSFSKVSQVGSHSYRVVPGLLGFTLLLHLFLLF